MNPVLYLIMRNDIPSMNPGKLAAQAAHVANAFEYEFGKSGQAKKNLGKLYKAWKNQTKQGFGTTITLAMTDFHKWNDGYSDGCFSGCVFDPTYPCIIPWEIAMELVKHPDFKDKIHHGKKDILFLRREFVGGYVFGDKDNQNVQDYTENLELYP